MATGWNTADEAVIARLITEGYTKDEAARLVQEGYTHATGIDTNPIATPVYSITGAPLLGGLLEGQIFGVDKKLVVLGVIAFFVFKK